MSRHNLTAGKFGHAKCLYDHQGRYKENEKHYICVALSREGDTDNWYHFRREALRRCAPQRDAGAQLRGTIIKYGDNVATKTVQ